MAWDSAFPRAGEGVRVAARDAHEEGRPLEQGAPVLEIDYGRRVTARLSESSGFGPGFGATDHFL